MQNTEAKYILEKERTKVKSMPHDLLESNLAAQILSLHFLKKSLWPKELQKHPSWTAHIIIPQGNFRNFLDNFLGY